jgi:hypothetical protein
VHHRTIQINHQPDATVFQFIILTFVYSSTCFGRFPAHHQELNDCSGSLWFYLRIVVIAVLCSWSGRPARPQTQHDCHHGTKVKPEAATAVIELLMTDGKTPETCWVVNKRQDNKLKNCASGWWFIWIKCKTPVPKVNYKFRIFVFIYTFMRDSDDCLIKLPKLEALLDNKRYCLKIQLRLRVHLSFVYSLMTLKFYVFGDSRGNIQPLRQISVRTFILN